MGKIGHGNGFLGRLLRTTRGAVGLEFAVLAPVLILMFSGAFEFALMYKQYEMGSAGARDAARYLARVPDPDSAGALTRATNLVTRGTTDTSGPMRVAEWEENPELVDVSVQIETYLNAGPDDGGFRGPDGQDADIDVVYVIVDITYPGSVLALVGFEEAIQFTVVHSERHIGQ